MFIVWCDGRFEVSRGAASKPVAKAKRMTCISPSIKILSCKNENSRDKERIAIFSQTWVALV